uniref:DNA mismatch repair protein n=1 Tax=Solanum tuberosum TaxID=4113 RepID=M0ZML9_SOLTU
MEELTEYVERKRRNAGEVVDGGKGTVNANGELKRQRFSHSTEMAIAQPATVIRPSDQCKNIPMEETDLLQQESPSNYNPAITVGSDSDRSN